MENGFYKIEDKNLLFAPNFVFAPGFTLIGEEKDIYEFPVDGWYWFDSLNDANGFFGLPLQPTGQEAR